MKRYLILILLLILSNTQINRNIRDIINAIDFMILNNSDSIKDKDLKDYLGENCLNDEFMKSVDQFIYGIKMKNPNEMSLAIISMFTEITSNCDSNHTFTAGKIIFQNLKIENLYDETIFESCSDKFFDLYTSPYSNANNTGEFIGFILYNLIKPENTSKLKGALGI